VDQDNIPYGDDTVFVVDSDDWNGYRQRIYYYDLTRNNFYNYSFYLARNVSTIHLYYLRVLNEVDTPVAGANVNISVNVGGSYVSVAQLITDSNGYASLYLNSSKTYQVNINLSGYEDESAKWYPDDEYYGIYYPKIFKLEYTDVDVSEPENPATYITFEGYINSTSYLILNYTDAMGQTLNTAIYVYEINLSSNNTWLNNTFTDTTDASYQVSMLVNTSNNWLCVLHLNHTVFGYQKFTIFIQGGFVPLTNQSDVDSIFSVFGDNALGWSNFIMFLLLVAGCVIGDSKDAGMYMVLLGGIFLFINYFIGFNTTLGTFAGGVVPVLFIIAGIVMAWNDKRKRVVS